MKRYQSVVWHIILGEIDIDYQDIPIKGSYKVSISNTLMVSKERVELNGEVECKFNVDNETILHAYNKIKTPKHIQDEDP
ncbi:hypothetical protein [Solibacillus sp. FSL K6-1126]|uniref:hypothetical protein n=1 Tax=Solibacillus sp. FSL K6-1126 TaxID=2921463 RepID=UPI0030F7C5C4